MSLFDHISPSQGDVSAPENAHNARIDLDRAIDRGGSEELAKWARAYGVGLCEEVESLQAARETWNSKADSEITMLEDKLGDAEAAADKAERERDRANADLDDARAEIERLQSELEARAA